MIYALFSADRVRLTLEFSVALTRVTTVAGVGIPAATGVPCEMPVTLLRVVSSSSLETWETLSSNLNEVETTSGLSDVTKVDRDHSEMSLADTATGIG